MSNTPTDIMANASVRVDSIFWIPGQSARTTLEFEFFLNDHAPVAAELLGVDFDEFGTDYEGYVSAVLEKGKSGFIIQASTMRPFAIGPGEGNYSLDWSRISERFFYFDEFDQSVIANALADWGEDVFNAAMVRYRLTAHQKEGTSNE